MCEMHVAPIARAKPVSDESQTYSKTLRLFTVGNQNGSFQRKCALPVPFGGRDGSFRRKTSVSSWLCLEKRFFEVLS